MSHQQEDEPLSDNDATPHAHVSKNTAETTNGNTPRRSSSCSPGGQKLSPIGRPEKQGNVPPSGNKPRIRIRTTSAVSPSMKNHSTNINRSSESKGEKRPLPLPHDVQESGTPDSPGSQSSQPTKQNGSPTTVKPDTLATDTASPTEINLSSPSATVKPYPSASTASKTGAITYSMTETNPSSPLVSGLPLTRRRPPSSPITTTSSPKKRDRDPGAMQIMPDAKRVRTPQRNASFAPQRALLSTPERGLLATNETLPDDVDTDGNGIANEDGKTVVEGLAKLPEDSLAMRHESWRKLREIDSVKKDAKLTSAAALPVKAARAKATAAASDSLKKEAQEQEPKTFPPFESRYARRAKPPPSRAPVAPSAMMSQVAGPSLLRSPRSAGHPMGPLHPGLPHPGHTAGHPPTYSSHPMAPSAESRPVAAYNRPSVPSPMAGRTARPPFLPKAGPAHAYAVPRGTGTRPFKVTKDQICDAIPKNASCIFHIMDRRVNLDSFPPDASFYSLMRAWALDDPYRQIPPQGSNILSMVSLPSNCRRVQQDTILSETTHRHEVTTGGCTVNVAAKLQSQESQPSVTSLRHELVAKSKLLKRLKRKEDSARMEASRESLKSMGIDLTKRTERHR